MAKPIWPTKAVIDRFLQAARDHGCKAPGFRVDPSNGAIEVFESANGDAAGTAYDRWKSRKDQAKAA